MIELHATKELVKGIHNDTQHQGSAHPPKKQSYRLLWGAADQCTMSHGNFIHIMV